MPGAARGDGHPRLFALLRRRPVQPLDAILPPAIPCACGGGGAHPIHWQHRADEVVLQRPAPATRRR